MKPSPTRNHRSQAPRRRVVRGLLVVGVSAGVIYLASRVGWLRFPAVFPTTATSAFPAPAVAKANDPSTFIDGPGGSAGTLGTAANSPEKDRLTVESIQALAARDSSRALTLALAETDPQFRDELIQAALRVWADTDAMAAADWARSQTHIDRGLALAAVFNGASQHPDEAVRLGRRLAEENPEHADSYAGYLIFALNHEGRFELAANVAAASGAEARTNLLTAAYCTWGEHQPSHALAAAMELKDPDMRRAAFEATLGGWAKANPQELSEVAIDLPAGPDRTLALTTALRHWIDQDPATAAEWAARVTFSPGIEAALED